MKMRLETFAELAEIIEGLAPAVGDTIVVGIDGGGGSGKTTFARDLSEALHGCPVVHTDDFASWEEPFHWWPRLLDQVLQPLSRGEPARYQRYDWVSKALAEWITVEAPVVIVEGVSSLRREFRPYLAYRIWVDCPPDERLRRGLVRDGEEMRAQWLLWMAAEDRYREDHDPVGVADLVVNGFPIGPVPEASFKALSLSPPGDCDAGVQHRDQGFDG